MLRRIFCLDLVLVLLCSGQSMLRRAPILAASGSISNIVLGVGSGDPGATTVATAAMNCTGNNTMVVIVEGSGDVVNSVADNINSGYTLGGQADSNVTDHIRIAYKFSMTPNAAQVVTATFASASTFRRIRALCFNAPLSAQDGTDATNNATGQGDPSTATVGPITPGVATNIWVCGIANNNGGATWTANNGFTNQVAGATDTQVLTKLNASGATTCSGTMTVTGSTWRAVGGVVK